MDIMNIIKKYKVQLELSKDDEERKKLIIGLRMLQASLSNINIDIKPYLEEIGDIDFIGSSLDAVIMQKKNHIPTEMEIQIAKEIVESLTHYIDKKYKGNIDNAFHVYAHKLLENKKYPGIESIKERDLAVIIENIINSGNSKIRSEVHHNCSEVGFCKIPGRFAFGRCTEYTFDVYIYIL